MSMYPTSYYGAQQYYYPQQQQQTAWPQQQQQQQYYTDPYAQQYQYGQYGQYGQTQPANPYGNQSYQQAAPQQPSMPDMFSTQQQQAPAASGNPFDAMGGAGAAGGAEPSMEELLKQLGGGAGMPGAEAAGAQPQQAQAPQKAGAKKNNMIKNLALAAGLAVAGFLGLKFLKKDKGDDAATEITLPVSTTKQTLDGSPVGEIRDEAGNTKYVADLDGSGPQILTEGQFQDAEDVSLLEESVEEPIDGEEEVKKDEG